MLVTVTFSDNFFSNLKNWSLILLFLVVPYLLLSNCTPFLLLLPLYTHLMAFGCLRYASTLTCHHAKFSPRATSCVFLEYPPSYKGYKILDLSTNVAFISWDVVFHENIFPFKTISTLDASLDTFLDRVLPLLVSLHPHMIPHFLLHLMLHRFPLSFLPQPKFNDPHLTYRITIVLPSPLSFFFPLVTLCLKFLATLVVTLS